MRNSKNMILEFHGQLELYIRVMKNEKSRKLANLIHSVMP